MYSPFTRSVKVLVGRSINQPVLRVLHAFLIVSVVLAWFVLPPIVHAQDGDELNRNTAEGANALPTYIMNATSASDDTAIGNSALFSDTDGFQNTAVGSAAVLNDTSGSLNVAIGASALLGNTSGTGNTATGFKALFMNTTGFQNTFSSPLQQHKWQRQHRHRLSSTL
jgi:ABC-type transport system involved in cytochrome bd biosynthesis fused ATPase/permease subunit